MDRDTAIVISAIIIVAILYVVLYFVKILFFKGTDAVENAFKRKRAEKDPPKSESLADRLKSSSSEASRDKIQQK